MRLAIRGTVLLVCLVTAAAASAQDLLQELVALERAAADRWIKGDPGGYLDLMAPDVTIIDAFTPSRVDGHEAAVRHYAPLRGQVSIPRYEVLSPTVQALGADAALLTFQFVGYGGRGEVVSRWNFSEVYERRDGRWRIVHSHASRVSAP